MESSAWHWSCLTSIKKELMTTTSSANLTLPVSFQSHTILHRLSDWRDTSKLTHLELPFLPPLLTIQYPVFWGPSGWHSSPWTTRSTFPMDWCPLVKSFWDSVAVYTLKICQHHCSLRFLIVFESIGCLVEEHIYLFAVCCDHTICKIFLWHLISNISSLA